MTSAPGVRQLLSTPSLCTCHSLGLVHFFLFLWDSAMSSQKPSWTPFYSGKCPSAPSSDLALVS